MNIRKFAVIATSILHLRDASDELMYADGADGNPDLARPMQANLYGPGSKQFKAAQAASSNKMIERMKKKGKTDQSAAEQAEQLADFLTACTLSLENIELDSLTGDALIKAVYTTPEIGFVAEQVNKHISDWANFTQPSPAK
jgi:hypothetical protein